FSMLFDNNDLVIEEKGRTECILNVSLRIRIVVSHILSERQESDCEEHWPIDLPVYSGINKPKRCYRIFSSLDQWSENDEMKDDNNTDDKNLNNKIKHKPLLVDTPITDTKSENNHLFTDKLQKPLGSSNDSYGNNYNIDKNEQCNDKTEIDKNENCNKEMYSNMPEGYYLKMRFGDFGYRHRCGYGTDDEDG
ncbi:11255_t:CDS:2, partial [Paraglomus brasilianum]